MNLARIRNLIRGNNKESTLRIINLFPDTNIFIQCLPLEELDWSNWSDYDEVRLIVTRPVQREIDNQKNKRNDRVGKRARQTNSLFRNIIISEDGYKLIQKEKPIVKLLIDSSYLPSKKLANRLDYNNQDDALIGCIHAFAIQNNDTNAQLLTHDTGPMNTAKMLNLPFFPIPDDWLLAPESDQTEREANRLKAELDLFQKSEPRFDIICVNNEGNQIETIDVVFLKYIALTDDDISKFMDSLKQNFPQATDFGSREPIERKSSNQGMLFLRIKEIFTPASDEEITEYTDTKYPAWLNECEETLNNLYVSLQREFKAPSFCFAATNTGTRPGKDTLITINALGDFKILAPSSREDEADLKSKTNNKTKLQKPPNPPKGEWSKENIDMFSLSQYRNPFDLSNTIQGVLDGGNLDMPSFPNMHERRDPNGIFWKPTRPMSTVDSFVFECEQWRHGLAGEEFSGQIIPNYDVGEIKGALECQIHAENLSKAAKIIIPIIITIKENRIYEYADELVTNLINEQTKN